MKSEVRLLIADDHPIFRKGLRQVIEKDPLLRNERFTEEQKAYAKERGLI